MGFPYLLLLVTPLARPMFSGMLETPFPYHIGENQEVGHALQCREQVSRDFVESLGGAGLHDKQNTIGCGKVGAWITEVVIPGDGCFIPLLVQSVVVHIWIAEIGRYCLRDIASIVICRCPPCWPDVNVGREENQSGYATKKP